MVDTGHNGWEDIFKGVFEIEKVFGKLDATNGAESHSPCRADKLEKENESLYKLVDKLQDDLVKKDEEHAAEIAYWKKVADGFSNASMKVGSENTVLENALSETKANLEKLNNDYRSLSVENGELIDKVEHLQKELDEAASTNIELGKKVDDLQMNEQKLRGEKYNLAAQISIAIQDNNRLRKSLDRTQINDEAIIPMLHKLNKAFVESVSDKANFGEWLQAYSHFCALCDAFSEIYYVVDEKYPEEHIFELIDDFLLNIKDDFEKQIEVQKKLGNKENN